jgi:protein-tyrosine-phosphatase
MPSILFVCTANQFRSPLAAACLLDTIQKTHQAGDWRVESAGTWTKNGAPAPAFVRRVAKDLEMQELENHRTRQVSLELLSQFDLIVVMEAGHKEALCIEFPALKKRVHTLSEIVEGSQYDIPDPVSHNVNPDDVVRELISLIHEGQDKIFQLAKTLSNES